MKSVGHAARVTLAIVTVALNAVVPARPVAADYLPPFPQYATGATPQAVAVGDLNLDGVMDLVSTNYTPGGVSVLMGDGAGGYLPHVDLPTGTDARNVAIADMNGDGFPDLLVVNYTSKTLSLLPGNGDGTFGPKSSYTCGNGPQGLAVGDLNGDGNLDVTVANLLGTTVSVFMGTGTGSLGTRTDWTVGTGPRSQAMCDVNGDGRLDVVTANSGNNTVSVLPGNGAGGFGARSNYVTGSSPRAVAAADLNGDGRLDLVVPNSSGNSVSVLVQNVGGGFAPRVDYATGGSPQHAVIADFTGDGRLDVVVVKASANTISILPGNGDGTLGSATSYDTGASPQWVATAQLNADAVPDLVVANSGSSTVSVALSTPPAPHVAVSPAALDFGSLYVGQASPLSLRVSNAGSAPLTVSSITLSGSEFSLSGPTSFGLAPGAWQDVSVTYLRTTEGTASGTLTIASDDPVVPSKLVALTGTALLAPVAGVSPDTLKLGALVGNTTSGPITVSNTGLGALTYSVVSPGGAPPWLGWTPGGGTVAPGSSADVTVNASAVGLGEGEYTATIRISTNDSAHPVFDVPVRFAVVGEPRIAVSPASLDFGSRYVGQPDSMLVRVSNVGSGALVVSSMTVDSGEFALVGSGAFLLYPGGWLDVPVTYLRTTGGTASGTLTITSNAVGAPATLIPMTGTALLAPVIRVEPDSVRVALAAGDSADASFTISNSGVGVLSWEVGSAARPLATIASALPGDRVYGRDEPALPASSAPPGAAPDLALPGLPAGTQQAGTVLVLGDGTSEVDVGAALAAEGYAPTYVSYAPYYWDGTNPSPQGFSLVVLLDGNTYGVDYAPAAQSALLSYVNSGGGLILTEWSSFEVLYGRYQILAPLVPVTRVSGAQGLYSNIVVSSHPVTAGVAPSFQVESGLGIGVLNSGTALVQLVDGTPTVVAAQYGAGRIVYFAHAASYGGFHPFLEVNLRRLLTNAAAWTTGEGWIRVPHAAGALSPGESAVVHFEVSARDLFGGRYVGSVPITSSDPVRPVFNEPVVLQVSGVPRIAVSPDTLDFGSRYTGLADSLMLRVSNPGTGTLEVSSLSASSGEFAVGGPPAFNLLPGSFRDVPVLYLRTSTGTANATLTIASNDAGSPGTTVALTGIALPVPIAGASPDTLFLTVASGSSASGEFTLSNGGLGALEYYLYAPYGAPPWLGWNPSSGTIVPGGSQAVTVTVSPPADSVFAGQYGGPLFLVSNDPLRPAIQLMVLVTVTGEPAIAVTPPAMDFGHGYVGYPIQQLLRVRNTGTAALTVSGMAASGAFDLPGTTSFVLPPASYQDVAVRDLHAALGTETGTLTITSDAATSPTLVPLTGQTLLPPVIAVAPESLAFELDSGDSTSGALTVRNDGESDLEIQVTGGAMDAALRASNTERKQDLASLLPTAPVAAAAGTMPPQGETALGPKAVRALASGSSTLVLSLTDVTGSVVRALDELGESYDYVYTTSFDSVDFSPYSRIIVTITGEYVSAGSVQALAAAAAEGRGVFVLGGTDYWEYYNAVESFLLHHTFQTGWTISGPPHLLVADPSDPLAAGLPAALNYVGYYTSLYMLRISDPAATVVATNGDGWPVLVHKPIGAGQLLYFTNPPHSYYWSYDADYQVLKRVLANAMDFLGARWLSVVPEAATIPPHASAELSVRVSASGLLDGIHSARLRVHSNDPVRPVVAIPTRLVVHGTPAIAATPETLDFGAGFVGRPDSLALRVSNPGTATLHVSAVSSSSGEFTVAGPGAFSLMPGAHQDLLVHWSRASLGSASQALTITSDAASSPTIVPLVGETRLPPVIAVRPSSFSFELAAGESTSAMLTVRNDGESDLEFHVLGTSGGGGSPALRAARRQDLSALVSAAPLKPRVGATPGAESEAPAPGVIRSVASGSSTLVITTTGISGSILRALAELGESYDYVYTENFAAIDLSPYSRIVVGMNGGIVDEASVAALASAAAGGRGLIIVGGSNWDTYYNGLQAYLLGHTGETGWVTSAAPHLRVVNRADALATGLPDSTTYDDVGASYFMLRINDAAATVVARNGAGYPVLVHKDVGAGELVYFTSAASDYYWGIEHDYLILRQVLANAFSFVGARWLSASPGTGVVPAHDSTQVEVRANASGLLDGTYFSQLTLDSNDPAQPRVTIPAQLVVHGIARIALSPDTLDFGVGQPGEAESLAVRVSNAGSAVLGVSALTVSNGEFTIGGPTAFSLLPGTWLDVPVTYARSVLGSASGTLDITSDDPSRPNVSVVLLGSTAQGPVASVWPDSLHLTLAMGDTSGTWLAVANNGLGPLQWTLSFDGPVMPWLAFSPPQGVVAPGGQQLAWVIADAGILPPGIHQTVLRVDTNDPNHPTFIVLVTVEVTGGPTPTALSLLRTEVNFESATLEWYSAERNLAVALYRREAASDWKKLCDLGADGTGRIAYEDRTISQGAQYGYRLGVKEGGVEYWYGETWIEVSRAVLALYGASPNPARADLAVSFSLPGRAPAQLEVFDIAGRRIASRAVEGFGPGRHEVKLGEGRPVEPGVYVLRLSSGRHRLTAKTIVVR